MATSGRREYERQHGGEAPPAGERDQCGYCGDWYTVGPRDLSGVCPVHRNMAHNSLTSEGH